MCVKICSMSKKPSYGRPGANEIASGIAEGDLVQEVHRVEQRVAEAGVQIFDAEVALGHLTAQPVTLHGFVQGLDIRAAEPACPTPLYELVEHRVPSIRRPREQLQEIAPFVTVGEHVGGTADRLSPPGFQVAAPRACRSRRPECAGTRSPAAELMNGGNDVVDPEREVLHSWAVVPGEERVDLPGFLRHVLLEQGKGDAAGRAADDN